MAWCFASTPDLEAAMASTSLSSLAAGSKRLIVAAAVLLGVITLGQEGLRTAQPRFYPDDPLQRDDDSVFDASRAIATEDPGSYDFVVNTFSDPGQLVNVRAGNINTIDEVPDSSWFQNRIGRGDTTIATIQRGPDHLDDVSIEHWTVSGGKSTGVQPGFQMKDGEGHLHQIEFDPPSNPEMASGAEIIGTAFYHALGYHTVEVYLADLDASRLVIAPDAKVWDPRIGRKRALEQRDLRDVLKRAARQANGRYRVLVSRFADGKPLGNFRYYGTRPDDPNDLVRHEHRRELRGARVFGAWLNHDDSRSVNSLDMLLPALRGSYVKHYMFDFGSILGSGTVYDQRHRAGNEYLLEWKPGWLSLATLGIYTRPWMHIDYPDAPPAVGRLEADAFDPAKWRPEYPNPAFRNMRADDAFWAARLVSRFSDAAIRAVVEKARFTDPRATDDLTAKIIKRRDKVVALWLTQVNPLIDFALSDAGELTFANAAQQAGVSTAATSYQVQWASFDNATAESRAAGEPTTVREARVQAPAALIAAGRASGFIEARVAATHPGHPSWAIPVTVHFRREGSGWALVGLTRLPE
jgi:hypothetical protein